MARPGDPIAELEVLDRRSTVELGVEAAGPEEDVAADQPAAGPEGPRGPDVVDERAELVDVVVQQVPEPADQARGGRSVVVGAEEAGEAGVDLEPGHGPGDGLGVDGDVGVEEEDHRALGGQGTEVPGRGRAELGGVVQDPGAGGFGEAVGLVGRPVVDDDQLIIGPGRVAKPSEAAPEVATPVVHGDHHRERRPPGPRARRTGGEIVP